MTPEGLHRIRAVYEAAVDSPAGEACFSNTASAQYQLTRLDSNQFNNAQGDDPLIVNAWGLARGAIGPWWLSDQGSGWATIYNGAGVKQGLVVSVPGCGRHACRPAHWNRR
jgi:hypothetical protein